MPPPDLVLALGLGAPSSWEERAQVVEIAGPDQADGWRRLLPAGGGQLGQLLARCAQGLPDGGRVALVAYGHATALVGQLLLDPQADQLDVVLAFAGHPLGQAEGWARFARRAASGHALLGFWTPAATSVQKLLDPLPRQTSTHVDEGALWNGPPNAREWCARDGGPTWTAVPVEQWEQWGCAHWWQAEAEGDAGKWFARSIAPELAARAVLWPRWEQSRGARWRRPLEPQPPADPEAPLVVDELPVGELDEGGERLARLARQGRQVLREVTGVANEAGGLLSAAKRLRNIWRG